MTDEAPPITPASTTTTKTETVKTTVGPETNGSAPSVIVVTQSKIALLNQAQASVCAVLFTLALVIGFLAPLFGIPALITSGEMIGVAGGVIAGAALRGAPARATDVPRAATGAATTP